MTGLQHLKELEKAEVRRKHPNLPESVVYAKTYQVSKANGLTKAIVAYCNLTGGKSVTRITSSGRMITKCRTEVKGSGKMVYIPGTTKKGTADISGTWNGLSLHIEVKIGKDRQSEAQKQMEQWVIQDGGYYFIAKDFESFFQWINQLKPTQS